MNVYKVHSKSFLYCTYTLAPKSYSKHDLSFLKLRVFINLHVILRKRRSDTNGMQNEELQNGC